MARQLGGGRLQQARAALPAGLTPTLGPISTGLGVITRWTVEARPGALKPDGSPYTPTDLREIQDWGVKPQLRTVKGPSLIHISEPTKPYSISYDGIRLQMKSSA